MCDWTLCDLPRSHPPTHAGGRAITEPRSGTRALRRSKDAARFYLQALQRTPDDPVVHFNLGLALEVTDGPQAALTHYERAVALDPSFSDAHYNLGSVCEELGRSQEAVRHYLEYKRLTQ